MFLNIHATHYNPTEWQEPEEFIPERFDPESKYFGPPPGSAYKIRSPLAHIPFSFGPRICAGKSLATLEIKTVVVYLLMKFDYEIDPEHVKNKYVRFGAGTQFTNKVKITKLH